ncbi:hypothetical protein KP509_14G064400 [Ceratopteris richardii]|uniref:BAH domain-containing protein n=1 Tax=Ceratopteris richardii TaxID=49495 RepID=A0A8T2TAB3_CERRI|nr:hypothetical protein KP509_14G064400 [Ceratopteris richardii]KAH7415889.1 hypothetical protein KP509_14G064400 [Ceratopteris richardii]KAH7415891.1 hypothetical protein KP509_14G064400 [Ceratopteris richardii]
MGAVDALVREEFPGDENVDDGKLSSKKRSGSELPMQTDNCDATADAEPVKDDDHYYSSVPLHCFIDIAQQQSSAEPATKRMKLNATTSRYLNIDSTMKHVADIVLTLAGLGCIRAGREPTAEERRLQAEAYGHLGFLVQELNPRDLVSQVAVDNLINDLGLRKAEVKEAKTFAQILEEFQPSIPSQMAQPPRMVTDSVTAEKKIDISDHQKSLISASRPPHHVHDSSNRMHNEQGRLHVEGEALSTVRKKDEGVSPHSQFAQVIQDILKPRYPADCPIQPAHSRTFMNTAMPCEKCKAVVMEIANVLVCDTCEKVSHLRCLQTYLLAGIPKGDWHCPQCNESKQGKQYTPKYGRVKAGFSFSRASGMIGKSSAYGPSNIQNVKQLTGSIDGNFNRQAFGKTGVQISAIEHNLGNQVPSSNRSSQNISMHGNMGGGFTTLIGNAPEGEGCNKLLEAGEAASSQLYSHHHSEAHTSTRTAFLNLQAGISAAVLSSQLQCQASKIEQGSVATTIADRGAQSIQPAVSNNSGTLPVHSMGSLNGRRHSNSTEEAESVDEMSAVSGQEADFGQTRKEVDRFGVEWASDVIHRAEGKNFYAACTVGGHLYRVQDCALFRPETPHVPPYIARLQALWEDVHGAKWVRVNWCYYPADMVMVPGRPPNPEIHETGKHPLSFQQVYESNHGDNNLVGTIQGQCLVLQPENYSKEMEMRQELLKSGSTGENFVPAFVCRWIYDVITSTFRPAFGAS